MFINCILIFILIIFKFDFVFRKNIFINPSSKKEFIKENINLNELQLKILKDIKNNGYSVSNVFDLFQDQKIWFELKKKSENFLKDKNFSKSQSFFNENYDKPGKHYIYKLFNDKRYELSIKDPLIQIAISNEILGVVNSFFGLNTKVQMADLWYTFSTTAKKKCSKLA